MLAEFTHEDIAALPPARRRRLEATLSAVTWLCDDNLLKEQPKSRVLLQLQPGESLPMARTIEKRRRGVVGWITLILFLGWNGIMGWATYDAMSVDTIGVDTIGALSADQQMDAQADGGVGLVVILIIWGLGIVIFHAWAARARARAVSQERAGGRDI